MPQPPDGAMLCMFLVLLFSVRRLQKRFAEKISSIKMSLEILGPLPELCVADSARCQQVFTNLVSFLPKASAQATSCQTPSLLSRRKRAREPDSASPFFPAAGERPEIRRRSDWRCHDDGFFL